MRIKSVLVILLYIFGSVVVWFIIKNKSKFTVSNFVKNIGLLIKNDAEELSIQPITPTNDGFFIKNDADELSIQPVTPTNDGLFIKNDGEQLSIQPVTRTNDGLFINNNVEQLSIQPVTRTNDGLFINNNVEQLSIQPVTRTNDGLYKNKDTEQEMIQNFPPNNNELIIKSYIEQLSNQAIKQRSNELFIRFHTGQSFKHIVEKNKPVVIYDERGAIVRNESHIELTTNLPLLSNYRNPCWSEMHNGFPKIRCLPYFYLLGAPKSGTTDLHRRMVRHPLISSHVHKEPHWLTRRRFLSRKQQLTYYLNMFDHAASDIVSMKQANGFYGMVVGDSSASNLWDNKYLVRNGRSYNYTNADVIYTLNKHAKLIAILREPVSRMHSDYMYFFKSGTADSFHAFVVDAMSSFEECMKNNAFSRCAYIKYSTSRLIVGVYYEHLTNFFRVFPRSQIMLIRSENYATNIPQTLKDVFDFLEIGQPSFDAWSNIIHSDKANQRSALRKEDMLPKTKQILQNFYRPYNTKLVELLGEKFDFN